MTFPAVSRLAEIVAGCKPVQQVVSAFLAHLQLIIIRIYKTYQVTLRIKSGYIITVILGIHPIVMVTAKFVDVRYY